MSIFSKRNRRKMLGHVGTFTRAIQRFPSRIFRPIQKATKWLFGQFAVWWKDRRLKNLLFGIPAIIFLATCTWVYVQHKGTPLLSRANAYLKAGETSFQNKRWENASLFLSRAIEMGINQPSSRFQLAQAAEKIQDRARMVAILEELAPEDRAVHAPAHLWKAVNLLTQKTPNADEISQAISQLELALQLEPKNRSAHGILGEIQFQLGQWANAAFHLERSAPDLAQHSLKLCQALIRTQQEVRANTWARRAETQAKKSLLADSQDTDTELVLAEALILQDRFTDAEAIVLQALNRVPENLAIHSKLARVYLTWTDWVRGQSPPPPNAAEKCLQLLCAAIGHDPNNFQLFDRLLALMLEGGTEIKEDAADMLRDNISRGVAAGMNHLILGTFLDAQQESKQAAFHLNRAFELMDNTAIVANNLAWNLARRSDADLERAERLIERVLEENPAVPAFIETRGQVHLKQGHFKEALDDLEFALPHFPKHLETHEALTQVYAELGLTKLASKHQEIADQLKSYP